MKKSFNTKLFFFIVATLFGIVLSIPSFFQTQGPKITLGLDLQGGLNLLLGVQTQEAIKTRYTSLAAQINYYALDEQILLDRLSVRGDFVSFELLDSNEKAKIDAYLKTIPGLNITENNLYYTISFTEAEIVTLKNFAIEQAIGNIRNRLDQFGLSEPSVTKQGEDAILVQLPGIKTQEDEQRALELISKGGHLQMMAVDEARNARVFLMTDAEAESYGDVILPFADDPTQKILLKAIPILDGAMLTDARAAYDQNGQSVINFTLNAQGGKIFGDFSGKNVGNRMAIVLDGKVYSAPVIRERIGGGSGQISGGFSVQQ
ncbi:SecDF P1 head subdomain-containing protein, partial [Helicobacter sp.]|nr:protein translocase subunit SecD [Helicobacter sp.]